MRFDTGHVYIIARESNSFDVELVGMRVVCILNDEPLYNFRPINNGDKQIARDNRYYNSATDAVVVYASMIEEIKEDEEVAYI